METFLIKALQLILSLSILVIVHEFGHFIFARIFKVRVEKFYLFFDPWFSLFKFKRGGTEYGVGWLPQYSIQRELDEGRLTILDDRLSLPIGAWLYRSGSRLNQAAERFWQHIKTRNEPRE